MSSTGRITLASSTKTSLHERFTKLAAVAPKVNPIKQQVKMVRPVGRQNVPLRTAVKSRNQAVQLGNRPTVQAALRIKNKTLKQRLGGVNTNKPVNRNQNLKKDNPFSNRKNLKSRLGGGIVNANAGGIGARLGNRLRFKQGTTIIQRSNSTTIAKPTINQRVRNNQNKSVLNRVNNRVGFKNKTKSPKINNLRGRVQTAGIKGNFRKSLTKPNTNTKAAPTNIKKSLDMDLDAYMSKTKTHLDNDLDQYMSKSKTHLDADLDTYMSQASAQ